MLIFVDVLFDMYSMFKILKIYYDFNIEKVFKWYIGWYFLIVIMIFFFLNLVIILWGELLNIVCECFISNNISLKYK